MAARATDIPPGDVQSGSVGSLPARPIGLVPRSPMPTGPERDYKVGYGKPPLNARFQKGQSGNPRGRPKGAKNFTAVVTDALNQAVVVTASGRRRSIPERDLVIAQLVNKFAKADLRATKILLGILQEIERRAAPASAETPSFGPADEKEVEELVARLRRS